jgi:hypothetical protein
MKEIDMDKLQEADEILVKIEKTEEELARLATKVEMTKEDAKEAKACYDAAVTKLRALCRIRKESNPLFDQAAEQPKNLRELVCIDIIDGPHEGKTVPVWSVQQDGVSVLLDGVTTALTIGQYECDEEPYRLICGARDAGAVDSVQAWEDFLRENYQPEKPQEVDSEAWREYTLSYLGIEGKLQERLESAGLDQLGKLADAMDDVMWYRGIKGVGVAAADLVADKFAEFWKAHPEFCDLVDD